MARGRDLGAPRGRRAAGAAFLAALLAAALGGARAQCSDFACPGKKCKKACNSVSDCGWAGPKGAGDAGCVPLAQFFSAFKKKKGCGKHKKKCSWNGSTCSAGGSPPAPTPNNADRACGALSTKDARVFGPVFWKAIHIIGQWITSPSDGPGRPEMTERCVKFVAALPLMLPCAISGANFLDYVKSHPLINQVCDSKKNFVNVMVDAQNHISSYTTRMVRTASTVAASRPAGIPAHGTGRVGSARATKTISRGFPGSSRGFSPRTTTTCAKRTRRA